VGQYLVGYDPEYANGRGFADWSADLTKARTWPDYATALAYWRQVPRARPTRPDGRPNRPLTSFTVTVEPL
jgi:hypothetical protein